MFILPCGLLNIFFLIPQGTVNNVVMPDLLAGTKALTFQLLQTNNPLALIARFLTVFTCSLNLGHRFEPIIPDDKWMRYVLRYSRGCLNVSHYKYILFFFRYLPIFKQDDWGPFYIIYLLNKTKMYVNFILVISYMVIYDFIHKYILII